MKWKTRDGRVLDVSEMDDQHLINTYNMVGRIFYAYDSELRACLSLSFNGEMAQMAQEAEADRLYKKTSHYSALRLGFLEEIRKRRLKLK